MDKHLEDLAEIIRILRDISESMSLIVEDPEVKGILILSEISLKDFLENEPNLYSIRDLKT